MCEADLSSADQVVIFKGDFAINLTNSTTWDLVFMGGTKFYPVYAESSRWNTLMEKEGWERVSVLCIDMIPGFMKTTLNIKPISFCLEVPKITIDEWICALIIKDDRAELIMNHPVVHYWLQPVKCGSGVNKLFFWPETGACVCVVQVTNGFLGGLGWLEVGPRLQLEVTTHGYNFNT